jgi:hypothetical protein
LQTARAHFVPVGCTGKVFNSRTAIRYQSYRPGSARTHIYAAWLKNTTGGPCTAVIPCRGLRFPGGPCRRGQDHRQSARPRLARATERRRLPFGGANQTGLGSGGPEVGERRPSGHGFEDKSDSGRLISSSLMKGSTSGQGSLQRRSFPRRLGLSTSNDYQIFHASVQEGSQEILFCTRQVDPTDHPGTPSRARPTHPVAGSATR